MPESAPGLDPVAQVVATYGLDASVRVGAFPRPMALRSALAMEDAMCPAGGTGDVLDRARYLVRILAAGGTVIQTDHQQYLAPLQPE